MDKKIHDGTPRAVLNAVAALEAAGFEVIRAHSGGVTFRYDYGGTRHLVRTNGVWITASLRDDGIWETSTTREFARRTGLSGAQHHTPAALARMGVGTWRSALDAARSEIESYTAA